MASQSVDNAKKKKKEKSIGQRTARLVCAGMQAEHKAVVCRWDIQLIISKPSIYSVHSYSSIIEHRQPEITLFFLFQSHSPVTLTRIYKIKLLTTKCLPYKVKRRTAWRKSYSPVIHLMFLSIGQVGVNEKLRNANQWFPTLFECHSGVTGGPALISQQERRQVKAFNKTAKPFVKQQLKWAENKIAIGNWISSWDKDAASKHRAKSTSVQVN